MATAAQIQKGYIDYVLTHYEQPKSVYSFAKKLKITEADFYSFYASFNSIEKNIWFELTSEAIHEIAQQEHWAQYTAREKVLSFFYSYVELLKSQRSFVIYSLKKHGHRSGTPEALLGAKAIFENFAEETINEGLESGELVERKFFSKRYKDALWIQFAFIVNFWIDDDSHDFEKTDEAIEKGIQVTFDLFQRSPIDNLFEYGKFLSQNSKFKERMRF
ncbi:TetR family transcriptional regulator C-terminal domain-containing protein [Pedobacter sp. ASV12]|uniref:TetR family transcriptional regulator C-terminal domain-containing protein n=1 Tax=Pedobacter sp. ASV12 TaxID=2795120 RepID=UPI0018EC0C92|nr:TetR family transcriptional regulator C-terminal domain-containing protein [Pedobacter sp. ASV12]